MEGFVLDLPKQILPESKIIIEKVFGGAYTYMAFKNVFFLLVVVDPTPRFLVSIWKSVADATQRIKIVKIEIQIAPAEEAESPLMYSPSSSSLTVT